MGITLNAVKRRIELIEKGKRTEAESTEFGALCALHGNVWEELKWLIGYISCMETAIVEDKETISELVRVLKLVIDRDLTLHNTEILIETTIPELIKEIENDRI